MVPPAGSGNDADGDGLDDDWENMYFGNITTADATTDSDGDGASDEHEYLSSTHPQDTNSLFAITRLLERTDGDTDLGWKGSTQAVYRIMTCPDLTVGDWTVYRSGIPGQVLNGLVVGRTGDLFFIRVEQE